MRTDWAGRGEHIRLSRNMRQRLVFTARIAIRVQLWVLRRPVRRGMERLAEWVIVENAVLTHSSNG